MSTFLRFYVLPVLARFIIRFIGFTAKIKLVNEEILDKIHKNKKGAIFAIWHGCQFIVVYLYRNKGCWIMTSRSRDGELQTRILSGLGYNTVRGSSSRGGMSALIRMIKKVRIEEDFAFPVDGPRGPYHEVKLGALYLAQKTGRPILPLGIAVKNKHVFSKAWDKYILPMPFTKCVIFGNEPIYVDEKTEIRTAKETLARAIDEATQKAEQLLE